MTWRTRISVAVIAIALIAAAAFGVVSYLRMPTPLTQAEIADGVSQCEALYGTVIAMTSQDGPTLWENGSVATFAAERFDGKTGTCQVERFDGRASGIFYASK
jgi:hypothetical protein